jgi:hypothetical protein
MIPSSVFELHEVHCTRYLFACEKCGEVLKKTEKDQHQKDLHSQIKCEFCSLSLESTELKVHIKVCPAKERSCLYCTAIFDLYNLTQHENSCGNRTDLCDICGKYIRLNMMEEHIIECIENNTLESSSKKRKPVSVNPGKKKLKNN